MSIIRLWIVYRATARFLNCGVLTKLVDTVDIKKCVRKAVSTVKVTLSTVINNKQYLN